MTEILLTLTLIAITLFAACRWVAEQIEDAASHKRVTGQPRDRRGRYATVKNAHTKHAVKVNHMNGTTTYFTL